MQNHRIGVVIPCYNVSEAILSVIDDIPDCVSKIWVIDDCCPENSGQKVIKSSKDSRVEVIFHETNQGVGGAVITGLNLAISQNYDFVVKIDGDGQMPPSLITKFITPLEQGKADYTKGNRFYNIEDVLTMPTARLIGNGVLSFLSKFSTGYWDIFDPTNGYVAINIKAARMLPFEKIDKRFFFESDLLFRLSTIKAVVLDIPMTAIYQNEKSNLRILHNIPPFLAGHIKNMAKRIFYNYFLRDFSIASIQLILGTMLFIFGLAFGLTQWIDSIESGAPASAGTVMLAGLPIITAIQMLTAFLSYDMRNTPKTPVCSNT